MANRLYDDMGGGFRGNTASFGAGAKPSQRGGFNSEQDPTASGSKGGAGQEVLSSQLPGNPHSSRGFRRALYRSQARGNRVAQDMPDKTTFGGKGFKKPNYFAQGGRRHGMHISTGAPATSGGDSGSDFGGS